jgi:hypothetical protein
MHVEHEGREHREHDEHLRGHARPIIRKEHDTAAELEDDSDDSREYRYTALFLLFIATFSGVVGFITGLFPARRAAKINPLDAIRYK